MSGTTEDRKWAVAVHGADQDIAKHQEAILQLKSYRNTLLPISQLPPEILSRIFLLVRGYDPYETRSSISWIDLSCVSRHWRSIALNCLTLWTFLPLQYTLWTQEMLRRSKNANLTVHATFSVRTHPPKVSAIVLALSHMARIKTMTLSNLDPDVATEIFSQLPRSAPQLEFLYISSDYFPGPRIPDDALWGTSRLHNLQLWNCELNWDSQILSSLTHLELGCVSSRPTTTQFLAMLSRLPDLQVLDLHDCLPKDWKVAESNTHYFLKHLRALRLTGTAHEIEGFMQRLSIPPTSNIALECNEEGTFLDCRDDFWSILSSISRSRSFPASKRPPITHTLFLEMLTAGSLSVKYLRPVISNRQLGNALPNSICHLEVQLEWSLEDVSSVLCDVEQTIKRICGLSPLGDLNKLWLKSQFPFSSQTIVEIFGSLPKLYTSALSGSILQSFLPALTTTLSSNPPQSSPGPSMVAFPALQTIILRNFKFDDGTSHSVGVEAIRNIFKQRRKLGFGIRGICLVKCPNLCAKKVEYLNKVISHVEWDGFEIGLSDDHDDSDE